MNTHEAARVSGMSPGDGSNGGATARGAMSELVDFVIHRAFYPVLMTQRRGPHKATIEHVQDATWAKINRFRSCGSVEEVVANLRRELKPPSAEGIHSDLRRLNLPVLSDLHDDFERKARELGFEPDTLLTSPFPPSGTGP